MKRNIILTTILSLSLICLVTLLSVEPDLEETPYFISSFSEVIDVHFTSQRIYIDTPAELITFNPSNYNIEKRTKPKNQIIGVKGDQVIFCNWENFHISSPEQIATKLEVSNGKGESLHKLNTSLTVRPINCTPKSVVVTDNYPNSLNRTYVWDTKKRVIREEEELKSPEEESSTDLQDFKQIYSNEEDSRHILIDHFNGIWFTDTLEEINQTSK